jgi:hypothetical protein
MKDPKAINAAAKLAQALVARLRLPKPKVDTKLARVQAWRILRCLRHEPAGIGPRDWPI